MLYLTVWTQVLPSSTCSPGMYQRGRPTGQSFTRRTTRLTSGGSIVPPIPTISLQLDSMYRTHRPDNISVMGMMYSDRRSVSVPPFMRSIPAPPVNPASSARGNAPLLLSKGGAPRMDETCLADPARTRQKSEPLLRSPTRLHCKPIAQICSIRPSDTTHTLHCHVVAISPVCSGRP